MESGLRVHDGNGTSKMHKLVESVEMLGLRNGCKVIPRFDQPRSICGKIFPVSDCLTKLWLDTRVLGYAKG